jgi:hypothetical protein
MAVRREDLIPDILALAGLKHIATDTLAKDEKRD